MTQVGKLFNKTPYLVRDIDNTFKEIHYVEEIIEKLLINYDIKAEDIVNVFSNNRDNILHFHIVLKTNMPKENFCLTFNSEDIEFTFEEFGNHIRDPSLCHLPACFHGFRT